MFSFLCHHMREDEKLEKAKLELRLVGIICIVIVILALWLVSLRKTLARNRENYTPVSATLESARVELGGPWQEFQTQLDTLQ